MLPKTTAQGIVDRVAAQVALFDTAITSSTAVGGGFFYPRVHQGVSAGGDFMAENDLIAASNTLDTATITDAAILPRLYSTFINALNSHCANASMTDLNTYLSGTGLHVSPSFAEAYYYVRNSALWGENVWSATQFTLGSIAMSGSGIGVFSGGTALGSGYHAANSVTNNASGMLQVRLVSGITAIPTQLDVRLTTTNDVATSKQVSIPAGTSAATPVSVGISGVDFFRSVTNIVPAGGSAGLTFTVTNQFPERVIAL